MPIDLGSVDLLLLNKFFDSEKYSMHTQFRLDIEDTIDVSDTILKKEAGLLENIIIKSSEILGGVLPTISIFKNPIFGTRYEIINPDNERFLFVTQENGTSWIKIGVERNEIISVKGRMWKMYTSGKKYDMFNDIILRLFSSPVLMKIITVKMKGDERKLVEVRFIYSLSFGTLIKGSQGFGNNWKDIGVTQKQANRIRTIINDKCKRLIEEGERRRRQEHFDFVL